MVNEKIKLYSVNDKEFSKYGMVIDCDCSELISVAEKIELTSEGSVYLPSVDDFEKLDIKHFLEDDVFGETKIQVGYCYGHSTKLNAFEWHKSSEVNIAVTDAILFLGTVPEMENDTFDTKNAKAFLIKKGQMIEVYGTTLHFCPCETSADGFGVVIVLPEGTNTNLDKEPDDKKLFRKNKWIIAHEDNQALIDRGVVVGVYGKNYEVGKDL